MSSSERGGRRVLWFGAFGGAAAWGVQLLASVALGSATCVRSGGAVASFGSTWWTLAVISALALLVALASTQAAARSLSRERSARAGRGGAPPVPAGWADFVALAGLLLDGLFVVGVVASTLPLFMVSICR